MKFDRKKFESQLPPAFSSILEELQAHGLIPTLVGGTVRDFFLLGSLGKDWDIELSHETIAFNKNHWKDLGKTMSKFGKMTFLPYDIIRVEADGFQFEFSPPRVEHYRADAKDHSNFDAEFILNLPFAEAVKRRDFTINAMGVRFKNKKEWDLVDPLNGLKHLKEKILHPAGPDFSKDPVRFLRAYRFSQKLKFNFSPELSEILKVMHVDVITPAYMWSEMQKSGDPVALLETLTREKAQHPALRLPVELTPGKFLELRNIIADTKKHESWMIALEWIGISSESWRSFFSLSSDSARKIGRWAESSRIFQKLLPENFQGEFEVIRDSENFEKLFDWYFTTKQLLQKNPELPLMKMIEDYLPAWIYLYRFEAPKDVKHIDPPFRAKYQVWNLCQRL